MRQTVGHSTIYTGNRADGDSTNIYGNVYGDVHFPDKAGGSAPHQCLRDLRVTNPRNDRERIEGDKDKLLKDCYTWILEDTSFQQWMTQGDSQLLWIKGDPGKGKTMLTMGVIAELAQGQTGPWSRMQSNNLADVKLDSEPGHEGGSKPHLLAYFFCQSTRPELNNAVAVLRGLIYVLVTEKQDLLQHVQKRHQSAGRQLFEGPNAIYAMREILSDILNDVSLPTTYLLVDALDECSYGLSDLLRIITDNSLAQHSRLKWLVTSRNLPEIERVLQPSSHNGKVSLELNASHISKAVATYVNYKVQNLTNLQKYDPQTQEEVQQQLREKAEGTFLWVSLVCKELEGVPLYRTRIALRELPPGLDPLYKRMAAQILAQKDMKTAEYCKDILQSVTLAFRPLRLEEISTIAGLSLNYFQDVQEVIDLIVHCGSFLTIREGTVFFVHLSAKDYFTSGQGQREFNGTVSGKQDQILHRLLDVMHSTLQNDICGLGEPGAQATTSHISNSSLPKVAYACEYWIEHLCACPQDFNKTLSDDGKVYRFLQDHLLHWLEAMGVLQKIPEASTALQNLLSVTSVSGKLVKKL
jgi:hypothetical protein